MIATIDDLARYAGMLLAQGAGQHGRVVSEDMLAEAFRVQYRPHPGMKGIGLTFRIRERNGLTLIGHNGSMPGSNAGLLLCPELGVGAVAVMNRAIAPSAEFGGGRLAAEVLAHELEERARSTGRPGSDLAVGPRSLGLPGAPVDTTTCLAGTYRPARGIFTNVRGVVLFGGQLRVRNRGGRLEVRGRAGPMRPRRYLERDPQRVGVFHLDVGGVDLPVVFDQPRPDEPPVRLWLDGIPTAFELHRQDPSSRRLHLSAALLLLGAIAVWRRRHRVRRA